FIDADRGDVGLLPKSECIDAADPSDSACDALDLAGTPRSLDGRLDGVRRIDIGAREFDHILLEIEASLEPGGWLRVTTTGTPGLFVFLLAGNEHTPTCLEPYGPIFLDLAHSDWLPVGIIPDHGELVVELPLPQPPLLPAGDYGFQEIGITADFARGNVSKPVPLGSLLP
ncbi:MAG: hypothetical protein AB1486_19225, partial [Planctomycetota bacterium]